MGHINQYGPCTATSTCLKNSNLGDSNYEDRFLAKIWAQPVNQPALDQILEATKVSLNHPTFFTRAFSYVNKHTRLTGWEEYDELTRRLERSQVQESTSIRNVLRTRYLANLLIDDKGEIKSELLPALIPVLENHLCSLGPERQYDTKRNAHIIKVLRLLRDNPEMGRLLKKVTRPLSNRIAENAIRHTLNLSTHLPVTDAHTRRALLAAWLCYLRQNVGSCFATAPAIVVHDEQPELFLQDMADLIATGRLKRTFGGIELSVPMSPSAGTGDLKKPLIFQLSIEEITPEIWYSPGWLAALEAAGMLTEEASLRDKILKMKEWLIPLIRQHAGSSPYCVISTEELMRALLLQRLGLTHQQIIDYENRPRTMIQSHLIMQQHTPLHKGGGAGIGDRISDFYFRLDAAYNSFTSLADNALLKTWEFTLASFSETKFEFVQWNLYASLGLQTNEPGGIGQAIYQYIQQKLDDINNESQEYQYQSEMLFAQVKTMESRLRSSQSEKDAAWNRAEYQSRLNEFYSVEEIKDDLQARAQALVNLYDALYRIYQELFKDYFQEVYDADLHEVSVGPFDDSPAGFRLVFKHGRSNTSQWTYIKNHHEFVDALSAFFVATEPQVAAALENQHVEKDLSEVVTAIINHVKTREFIESAFQRMAIAHRAPVIHDPLNHLDQVEKKPWVYTSGGTMNTLVSSYYRLHDKPTEAAKWVENETELLVFLADTLKNVPYKMLDPFIKGTYQTMLMQSPTHAFLLKPTLLPFKESWSTQEFTYTWIRDHWIKPTEQFLEEMRLTDEMMHFLAAQLGSKIPENFRPRFKSLLHGLSGPMNPVLFRDFLIDATQQDRGMYYRGQCVLNADQVDSLLYQALPLFPLSELRERIEQILNKLSMLNKEDVVQVLSLFDKLPLDYSSGVMGAHQLQNCVKALIVLSSSQTSFSQDLHWEIMEVARSLGYSYPAPIIFADTNWVKEEFGFMVSPGTGRLELWRLDYIGSQGAPMTQWRAWVNGSRPDLKWGVYVKPYEYGQDHAFAHSSMR